MRSILQLNRFTRTTFMLDALRWLNVHERFNINVFRKNMVNFVRNNNS